MQKNNLRQPKVLFKQKIFLAFFGVLLFIIILEIGLRLGGVVLLSMQDNRNRQSIKQKGAYRILCLGESTTQGEYPQFLEQALNRRNIGIRFSVIDKGRVGTETPVILNQLEAYLSEYHPDAVVAMMGINDSGKLLPFVAVTPSRGMLFIGQLRTYNLARLLWRHILAKASGTKLYNPDAGKQAETCLLESGLKEIPAESVPTEVSIKKDLEANPGNAGDYVELGQLYRHQGQFLQAEEAFGKADKLDSKNDKVYFGLGQLYRNQGKFSQSEEAFRKAIELNPDNDRAYTELGWLYLNQNKFLQAEESFVKAIGLNPKDRDPLFELGWFYRKRGRFREAENLFLEAIALHPENDQAYGAISQLYLETGKLGLAKKYAEKENKLSLAYYLPVTADNYRKLKEILDARAIRLVCVQYPLRSVESLKKIFSGQAGGAIFVDNRGIFKKALQESGYKEYFRDMFAGDFGHCTEKGNRLLAQNIADTILKEIFRK